MFNSIIHIKRKTHQSSTLNVRHNHLSVIMKFGTLSADYVENVTMSIKILNDIYKKTTVRKNKSICVNGGLVLTKNKI